MYKSKSSLGDMVGPESSPEECLILSRADVFPILTVRGAVGLRGESMRPGGSWSVVVATVGSVGSDLRSELETRSNHVCTLGAYTVPPRSEKRKCHSIRNVVIVECSDLFILCDKSMNLGTNILEAMGIILKIMDILYSES